MTMARRLTVGVGALAFLLAVGCQNPDKLQLQAQADEITRLNSENTDLRSRLAQAIADRDAARSRAAALERENGDLRGRLAAQQPMERIKGWEFSGQYAWTTLSTDFLFDSGKATLRSAARAKLEQVVSDIQAKFPDRDIWVLGHTDTDPINKTKHLWADNLDLSCNRGMTVYRELMKLGITPKRMLAGGQGEYFPRAENSTKASKQENRRVEIIAVPARSATGEPAVLEKTVEPPTKGDALTPVPK
jgi:chemotaxis protein MotB